MISSSAELGDEWVRLVKLQIDSWGLKTEDVDLLASHGQTILHQPDPENGLHTTLQIVDGDRLAAGTGIITVSDFRKKHIAAGYEGAPIVPLGEMLLFNDEEENRVLPASTNAVTVTINHPCKRNILCKICNARSLSVGLCLL